MYERRDAIRARQAHVVSICASSLCGINVHVVVWVHLLDTVLAVIVITCVCTSPPHAL